MAAGAVEGAKAWIPEEVEEEAKAVLNAALHHSKLQWTLREYVIQVGQDQARHPFVPLEEGVAKAVDEQADYRHLASRGIDTVLEVSVTNLGFVKGEPEEVDKANERIEESEEDEYKNLPFSLTMAARARLIRVSDNEPLSAATYNFMSREHKWSEWVVKENCGVKGDCGVKAGQAFGEAIGDGHRILAQQIVDEFFSVFASPAGTEIQRIERIPYRAFDPNSIKGLGVPEVKVRLATRPEVSQRWRHDEIVKALKEIDIADRLQDSIEGRWNKDQVVFKDRIFWEPYRRSKDVPPPCCDSPSILGAEQGKLVRRTLEDAAKTLAAVIVRRLK
jgi:hypothetical protein